MNAPTFLELARRPFFWPLVLLMGLLLAWDNLWPSQFLQPAFLDRQLIVVATLNGPIDYDPLEKKSRLPLKVIEAEDQRGEKLSLGDTAILMTALGEDPAIEEGDRIRFKGRLKKPISYRNPGVFDYARYLGRQGFKATVFISDVQQLEIVQKGEASWWRSKEKAWKDYLLQRMGSFSIPVRGVMVALLWGDDSYLDPETRDLFRDHGLGHLLVISGSHFIAASFLVFNFILLIGRIFPSLLLRFSFRKVAAGGTLVFLLAYAAICAPSPSVFRASIAIACYLLAILIRKEKDILNILFLAAFFILILQPSDLFDLSFQFSFLAVLSLTLLLPRLEAPFQAIIEKIKDRWPAFFSGLIIYSLKLVLASAAIFLGLTPLMLSYFHEYAPSSFVMNLVAIPFIELILVPLGLAALAFSWVPSLTSWFLKLDALLVEGVIDFLKQASTVFPKPVMIYPPHGWELLVYYLILGALVLTIRSSIRKPLLGVGFFVLILSLGLDFRAALASRIFRVTHLDVGQGDAVLVELPGAKRILIDGGGSPYFDLGKNVLIPYLLHRRIPALDAVCVTHADSDHYLGLITLLEKYPVGELWWNGVEAEDENYRKLLAVARDRGVPIRTLRRGMILKEGEESRFHVLSPESEGNVKGSKDNDESVVLMLQSGGRKLLFSGDIESGREEELIRQYGSDLKADYLKVPHHGSKTSSTYEFLRMVQPVMASVSLREGNRFGHPHPQVVERYHNLNIPLWRTDQAGALEIDFSDAMEVVPFRKKKSF